MSCYKLKQSAHKCLKRRHNPEQILHMLNILAMEEQETNYTNTFLHNVNYRQQDFTEITPQNKCLGSALSVGVIMQKMHLLAKPDDHFLKMSFMLLMFHLHLVLVLLHAFFSIIT